MVVPVPKVVSEPKRTSNRNPEFVACSQTSMCIVMAQSKSNRKEMRSYTRMYMR